MSPKAYSPKEVALHNTERDCWIVIRNKVYNVTTYLPDHPGGSEIVVDVSGEKDATADYDDVGHSEDAHEMLKKYYIGELDASAPISSGGGGAVPAQTQAPAAAAPQSKPVVSAPAVPKPTPQPTVVMKTLDSPAQEDDNSMMYIVGAAVVAAAGIGFFLMRRSKS